jgi:hypothetical protein
MKAYSGHQSDSCVQKYIDTSTHMKSLAANATALTSVAVPSVLGKRPSTYNPSSSSSSSNYPASTYNINISVAGDVSGNLGLWGKE